MRLPLLVASLVLGCSSKDGGVEPNTSTGGNASGGVSAASGGQSGGGVAAGAAQLGGAATSGGKSNGGAANSGGAAGGASSNGGASGGRSNSPGRGGAPSFGGVTSAGAAGSMFTGMVSPLTGPAGTWTQVNPTGLDLSSDYGAQDVLADPAHPGVFYGFACYQGVYRSTDWGATWAHVSTDGNIEKGRPWGEAIAPDGSYMLASNGYGVNEGAWKSTDAGVTWHSHSISSDNDPYDFDIDPSLRTHAIVAMHAKENIYESMDGGETWVDKGPSGGGGSGYVFFISTNTWLLIPQDGNGDGARRTTDAGATWAKVGPMVHAHGNAQIYIDPDNNDIYAAGTDGVYRSTNGGESFTQVSTTRGATVFGTGNRIYSMDPGANAAGTDPVAQSATRKDGTDWGPLTVPGAMSNGAKRAAVAYDDTTKQWVIVSGNWNAGFWRLIEK